MPAQSISSLEAQIASLTADITAYNGQLVTKQAAIVTQQAKLPGLKATYEMANQRFIYTMIKANLSANQDLCYDNPYLFPSSGGCYDQAHWTTQKQYFQGLTNQSRTAYKAKQDLVTSLSSQLNNVKGLRDDKVVERNTAIAAKTALLKAESDATLAAATAVAIKDPEIVKATLEGEKAIKDAALASNRKLFITAIAILAFVVVAIVGIRRLA